MQTIKNQIIKIASALFCVTIIAGSCKKFVDVGAPVTSATASTVYTNDAQAAAVVTSMYGKMNSNRSLSFLTGTGSITTLTGLTGDEFEAFTGSGTTFMQHFANSPDMDLHQLWTDIYETVYIANVAYEKISMSTGVSANLKKQLMGETRFMRAFLHFYLVNLYGDVPLVTTSDIRVTQRVSRTPEPDVYQQIIADLEEARDLLTNDYKLPNGNTTAERLRPNKAAATALLARAHLYRGNWAKAEEYASELINNANYNLAPLAGIYSITSKEAIWQLSIVNVQYNTYDGWAYIRTVAPYVLEPVALTPTVVKAFEPGDQRKTNWVDSITIATVKYYYPKKYKIKGGTPATTVISEHLTPFRLAEQYLIRAEARTKLGKLAGANSAQSDINAIRARAGLGNTTAATEGDLLLAIGQERRIELFCEFGHRWFDLKRTNRIDAVMSLIAPLKGGGTWDPNKKLWPLPRTEMDRNPNLAPQNPGYN